jgi:hypothetical protein
MPKLSTTPQSTTINRTVTSPTRFRISWNSDPEAIVNITNIGSNLSSRGFQNVLIDTSKTFIIDSINSSGLINQRIINFIYQPVAPTSNNSSLLYESGIAISLENNVQKMTLEG